MRDMEKDGRHHKTLTEKEQNRDEKKSSQSFVLFMFLITWTVLVRRFSVF